MDSKPDQPKDPTSWGLFKPLVNSLQAFSGNAKTCILVEPLWGIPYNLFIPYTSLYMLALGVSEQGIGLIATVTMVLQTLWSFTAGWITDRLGRRRTSLIFDCISWSIPTLLWAFARDFRWFLAAGVLNSMVRIVHISWSCLFIEDAPQKLRVSLYTWMSVASILAGFFAPLAGLLVSRLGLVPATRILYIFAFLSMTSMFFIRNALCVETSIGKEKIQELREGRAPRATGEYAAAARLFLRNREAVLAFLLAVFSNIHLQVKNNFLSVVLTRGIGLPESLIAIFPFLSTAVTLLVYLFIIPRIKKIRSALVIALGISTLANMVYFLAPRSQASIGPAIGAVILGTVLAALGLGVSSPVIEAVLANAVDEKKRAVTLSIVYTMMYGLSSPFGWLAGWLAELDPRYPALLLAVLMVLSLSTAWGLRKE